jgi:prepilin-type N-terminal cleavage/methylation domain-containing protein
MLQKFRSQHAGFTLVEIMIVVALIALLSAVGIPGFLRARKRAQAGKILTDLRMIDAAVDQYAIDRSKPTGFTVGVRDWTNYLKQDTLLYNTGADVFGHSYGDQAVDVIPSVPQESYDALSDVTDPSYWPPVNPATP